MMVSAVRPCRILDESSSSTPFVNVIAALRARAHPDTDFSYRTRGPPARDTRVLTHEDGDLAFHDDER